MAYIETTVLLLGTREAITSVLNRAFRTIGSGQYRIADDDSPEAVNAKIEAANEDMAGYKTAFTLMDYLDDSSRMDSPFKDYVLSYIDEEDPDGSENYDANPVEVTVTGEEWTLKICSRVLEGQRTYMPEDWNYWCGMVSVSDGVLVSVKRD